MWKPASGLLVAIATMAGVYATATTTASGMAGAFTTTQTESRTRNVQFESEARRASAEHKAALAKCEALEGKPQRACHREAGLRGPNTAPF